jgi:predicted permease
MLADVRLRLRALFRRSEVDAELEEEINFHQENEAEKWRRSGMSADAAKRQAHLSFGGGQQIREDCRDARGVAFFEVLFQDARYGARILRKTRSFFVISCLTLAIGIGASVAVFSLVNTVLLKPLPYPNADRVVMPWRVGPIGGFFSGTDDFPWSPVEFTLLARTSTIFKNLGAFKKESFNLTGSGTPELLEGVGVSAGFFPTLGSSPLIGRTFTSEEDHPGHEYVAILSAQLWLSEFHADPGIIGHIVELNGHPYTIIGVMPPTFRFPNPQGMPTSLDLPRETQLWIPLALPEDPRGANELGVVVELEPHIGSAQIQHEMESFEKQFEEQYPQQKGWSTKLVSLSQQTVSDTRQPLLLFLGAVSVVLLIACSNVAGLTLNRSLGRRREMAVRAAMGAGRGRLFRQLITESLMLAFAGCAVGIAISQGLIHLAKIFGPHTIPHLQETGIDLKVLAYAAGITFVTGVLFGLAPATAANRVSLVEVLKEGGQRAGAGIAAARIRNVLLIIQVALALVLVVAAGLLMRTFSQMLHSNGGFIPARVMTFELPLSSSRYSGTERMEQLYTQVLFRLRSLPGVESAGLATVVPMGGAPDSTMLRIPEHPTVNNAERPYSNYSLISPGYFGTIGAPLLSGRDFNDSDTLSSLHVTIINKAMARKYWDGVDPIGKQVGVPIIRFPTRTIIGVVADIKHASLREQAAPEMFVPYTQNEIKMWPSMQTMQFAVKTKLDATTISNAIRDAIHSIDPDLPIANFTPLSTLVDDSMTVDRFATLLITCFAGFALLLALIGMYGVVSYSVLQRIPEIGIRMALGAQRRQIFLMVVKQGSYLACSGIAIGLCAAFISTRLMRGFLYGVSPNDPVTFALVALLMVAITILACYIPARKAMKINPMVALRYE